MIWMNQFRSIRTNRLIIEPFSEKFLTQSYLGWLNNKKLMQFSEQRHHHHTIEGCRKYLLSFVNTPHLFLAISKTGKDSGHIGNLTVYMDEENKLADIAIIVGEAQDHEKGYATEAWSAICDYLFSEQDVRKITAGTLSENIPMLRLFKRTGMIPDGIRKKHYLLNGCEIDLIYYCSFRKDGHQK